MKPAYAWVTWTLLGAAWAAVSCSEDEAKRSVTAGEAGAGGEAGEPAASSGGTGVAPEGGGGGEPPVVVEGGVGGVGGAPPVAEGGGGQGGTPPEPLCFDFPAAGGAGGVPGGVEPYSLRCEWEESGDHTSTFSAHYDPASHKIVIDVLPELEPATHGDFVVQYHFTGGDESTVFVCEEVALTRNGNSFELQLNPDNDPEEDINVFNLTLRDECGGSLPLDNSSDYDATYCEGLEFVDPGTGEPWPLTCDEGYADECGATCPIGN